MDRQYTLIVQYRARRYGVGAPRPQLTIGRQADRDLVIPEVLVSKHHATIILDQGHFYLADRSRNGTYLLGKDRNIIFVNNNKHRLETSGLIALGARPGKAMALEIQYWTEMTD
ncbi:MAG: FHA domain-containing protein [Magnetococcus sp. DMHC-1]|nr:FHA domain-containing protein [Magnetococcales bacterium]